MKASAILIGVLLLVLFGACSVEAFARIDFLGIPIDIGNPLYMIGSINLVTVFGFAVTIRLVILILAIVVLLLGVFGK